MTTTRREFLARTSLAGAAAALAPARDAIGAVPPWWHRPATDPATQLSDVPDRLPIAWYRACVGRLQAKLGEMGLDGILLRDAWNIIYVSGYFHTTTERPEALWVPREGEPTLFVPGLDRDLVASWFLRDAEFYFDYPQAETNGDPRTGSVLARDGTANLWTWMLRGLDRRGFGNKNIGLDWEPAPTQARAFQDALPAARFTPAPQITLGMRMIKTPEEVALTQRAIDYHDRMLTFCRDLVQRRGASVTDFEVGHEAVRFGTELVLADIPHDGRPFSAAGVSISCGCRTGVGTAYPHPNQFFMTRVQRGHAIQFSGVMVRIGGYGGEGYRACQVLPASAEQQRMWDVHTEMTIAQREQSRPGLECREVAGRVLEIARRAGMEQYVYHRPAHGAGMEGHQPPYLSLGDATVIQEGMMFSNEPGLYNPQGGYGYNHSNNILITASGATQMNRTPLTREWCFLRI
jgi:Xaa-Pro aminopeptidase